MGKVLPLRRNKAIDLMHRGSRLICAHGRQGNEWDIVPGALGFRQRTPTRDDGWRRVLTGP
jgi:hypothetical protein